MATAAPSSALVGATNFAADLAGGDAFPIHTENAALRSISTSFSASPAGTAQYGKREGKTLSQMPYKAETNKKEASCLQRGKPFFVLS